ncbi:MAG: hypothetical protein ACRDBO_17755 [Lachnospiraceae bacterium]
MDSTLQCVTATCASSIVKLWCRSRQTGFEHVILWGLSALPKLPEEAPEGAPQHFIDYIAYYKTDRGYHSRSGNSNNGWAAAASGSLMNMRLFEYAPEIRNSVLLVHGDNARIDLHMRRIYAIIRPEISCK